jgi:uncharacterized protein (DUF697 family)
MNRKKLPRAIQDPGLFDPTAESDELPEHEPGHSPPFDNVIEMPAGARNTSARAVPSASATVGLRADVIGRRKGAFAIVARHAAFSALGGAIPLPVGTLAGVTAVNVRMVKSLSAHYGLPFERDRARAIVIGLIGGAMPTGFAAIMSSTLFFVVPTGALMSLAVSSATAAACTRGIGRIFVEHFENGSTLADFFPA